MKILQVLKSHTESLVIFVLTTASYILGIGLMSTTLRIMGIRLIDTRADGSSWNTPTGSADDRIMY